MSNIVNGFTDILGGHNFATNGNFRVNQRGLFTPVAVAKDGDYVADAWTVIASAIETVSCQQDSNQGWLLFTGTGKKGQYVSISNKDSSWFGQAELMTGKGYLTSKIFIGVNAGSVPILCSTYPRRRGSAYSTVYDGSVTVPANGVKQAVRIINTDLYLITDGAINFFYLQADGRFSFYVFVFAELLGGFRNPPQNTSINLADDITRCDRYFQHGLLCGNYPIQRASSSCSVYPALVYRTKMAGTPSVSSEVVNSTGWYMSHLPTTGNVLSAEDHANWSAGPATAITDNGCRLRADRGSDQTTYPCVQINLNYDLTV